MEFIHDVEHIILYNIKIIKLLCMEISPYKIK